MCPVQVFLILIELIQPLIYVVNICPKVHNEKHQTLSNIQGYTPKAAPYQIIKTGNAQTTENNAVRIFLRTII